MSDRDSGLTIIVAGASGHLARTKIYPALFALYSQGFLPSSFNVFGFARSDYNDAAFRDKLAEDLTCRYVPGESCVERVSEFLSRCFYVPGQYGSARSLLDLDARIRKSETGGGSNRMLYLAVPPDVLTDIARAVGDAGMAQDKPGGPWLRVVIEKPFGRDRESSDALAGRIEKVFREDQTYRIDHYLGKEVIQNLMVLRFANLVFEPIWNRLYVDNVVISWKEDIGIGGRGGYFDSYGIIRDVMQNHLMQMLALIAMEPPLSLRGQDVCDEKVKVLRSVSAVGLKDIVTGQYTGGTARGGFHVGYTEEEAVAKNSVTPTFAAAVLRIANRRWEGVPFLLLAGKGLNSRAAEIHVHFRAAPGNIFAGASLQPAPNELIIRVQPDETINLRITNKAPGLEMKLTPSDLDLRYALAFDYKIPDAYECLLLEVMEGDKSLFIRRDELAASWDVFTPVLREIEGKEMKPEPYPFGSGGPAKAAALAARYGAAGH